MIHEINASTFFFKTRSLPREAFPSHSDKKLLLQKFDRENAPLLSHPPG